MDKKAILSLIPGTNEFFMAQITSLNDKFSRLAGAVRTVVPECPVSKILGSYVIWPRGDVPVLQYFPIPYTFLCFCHFFPNFFVSIRSCTAKYFYMRLTTLVHRYVSSPWDLLPSYTSVAVDILCVALADQALR